MYFVACAHAKSLLSVGWAESSKAVELGINFKIFRDVAARYDAGEPSIGPRMNVVVADFPVQIDGPELFLKTPG